MDYLKTTTLEELKSQYSSHHGFVFLCNSPVSDKSIETLATTLKNQAITSNWPLLVTKIGNAIIFVYEDFDGPSFFSRASQLSMMGVAEVEPLIHFLKKH